MVYGTIRLVLFWEAFSLDQMRENDLVCITSPKPDIGRDPHLQCETCVLVSTFLVFSYLPFPSLPFIYLLFLPITDCVLQETMSQKQAVCGDLHSQIQI